MSRHKNPGIYAIWDNVTGKVYVGSSVHMDHRKSRHFTDLKTGRHPNSHLQSAFRSYGDRAFTFTVIEQCSPENLIEREQFWIDEFRLTHELYNASPTAGNQLGIRRSEETKRRMSEAQKNRTWRPSAETRAKMAAAKIGTHNKRGAKLSQESCQRISNSLKGKKASDETRRKLSAARLGNKYSCGHVQTEETVRKRVASRLKTLRMRNIARELMEVL